MITRKLLIAGSLAMAPLLGIFVGLALKADLPSAFAVATALSIAGWFAIYAALRAIDSDNL